MPFLLVIIAIFLGAGVATVRIGGWGKGGALSMTCTDNAADACALAASSVWALALNTLDQKQVAFRKTYNDYYTTLKQLLVTSNQQLANAEIYMNFAEIAIEAANDEARKVPNLSYCTVWSAARRASILYSAAATLTRTASVFISSARSINTSMKNLTISTKAAQKMTFCGFIQDMNARNKDALRTGAQYAQEYSCIGAPPAEVYVPSIISYELEVTKLNNPCEQYDPFSLIALALFDSQLDKITSRLESGSDREWLIYFDSIFAASNCYDEEGNLVGWAWSMFASLEWQARSVVSSQLAPVTWLSTLIRGVPSITKLISLNKKISDAMGVAGGYGHGRVVSVRSCGGVGDMLITGLKHVTFEQRGGCVSCIVGDSQGIAAFSDSTHADLDTRTIKVGFTPRLTSAGSASQLDNCSVDSGVNAGASGSTNDGGC
mgnify:CR=1 FL=1